jgi:NAD(P)-dependent dehydrogenase (short-subunit alcohol dehydrogenase family)
VVLVIGGTSGIGLATAQQVTRDGGRAIVCARDAGRVAAVVRDLPGATGVAADVTDPEAVERAVSASLEAHGRLDAVVLTAQAMAYGTVEQVPHEVFRSINDTAVHGTFHVARAVLPVFRAQGGGSLVVVSSLLAEITVPSMSSYCTAKWGQLGLVRTLQLELRHERDLHVSLVAPGAVDTPIYQQAGTYAGRAGGAPPPVVSPESVAAACVRAIHRPRRLVHVGPANRLTVIGFRLGPWLYDRMIGPLVQRVVLRGGPVPDSPGNVLEPRPEKESLRGGWRWYGRLARRRSA